MKIFYFCCPIWVVNIPYFNIFVKCPKSFFFKLSFIFFKFIAGLAAFTVVASSFYSTLLFLKNYFSILSICKIVNYWVGFCIVIFPVRCQCHILKSSRPTICKFFCFSSNSYCSYYLPIFFICITFCSGRRVFIWNFVYGSLGGHCLILNLLGTSFVLTIFLALLIRLI